jgi:hypothetical protein
MKEVEIKLALIKGTTETYPFFFTAKDGIHLGGQIKTVIVNIDALEKSSLIAIANGVQKGQIEVSDLEAVRNKVINFDEKVKVEEVAVIEEVKEELPAELTVIDIAKALLGKAAKDLITEIGSGELTDKDELSKGIANKELLEIALDLESKDKNRKSVIDAIIKRIEAIETCNGFMAVEEPIILTNEDNKA